MAGDRDVPERLNARQRARYDAVLGDAGHTDTAELDLWLSLATHPMIQAARDELEVLRVQNAELKKRLADWRY